MGMYFEWTIDEPTIWYLFPMGDAEIAGMLLAFCARLADWKTVKQTSTLFDTIQHVLLVLGQKVYALAKIKTK